MKNERSTHADAAVDIDIIVRDQRQAVRAERLDTRTDTDIAQAGRIGRRDADGRTGAGRADRDVALQEAVAQLRRREIPSGGRDGDVDGVEQPVARASLGREGVDGDVRDLESVTRGLDPSAVPAEFAAARADDACGLRERKNVADVGPEDDFATTSEADRRGVDERVRGLGDATCLRERTGALPATADMDATAVQSAGGEQGRGVEQGDGRRGDIDRAALARGGRSVDETALLHRIGRAEHDTPAVGADAVRGDLAGVTDHARGHLVVRLGGDDDPPSGRTHDPSVLDEGAHARGFDEESGDAGGGIEVEADGLARGEKHAARLGHDQAGVADLRREERDVATEGAADRAFVDDLSGRASAAELESSGEEVDIGDRQRRGDECADVDAGRGTEIDAVGIDEEDLAVGGKPPVDTTRVGAEDAIEDRRRRRRLFEAHGRVATDVEGGPVDDRAIRTLLDGEGRRGIRAGRGKRDLSGDDLPAGRQCAGPGSRLRHRLRKQERRRHENGARQREMGTIFLHGQKLRATESQKRSARREPSWSEPSTRGLGLSPMRRDQAARQTESAGPTQLRPRPAPS